MEERPLATDPEEQALGLVPVDARTMQDQLHQLTVGVSTLSTEIRLLTRFGGIVGSALLLAASWNATQTYALNRSVGEIEVTLAHLVRGQDAGDRRLTRVEAKVDGLGTRTDRVEHRLSGVETRLDRVETRLDGVETRLDGVETRLDGVENGLDGVGNRFDGVEARLDRASEEHRGLRDLIRSRMDGDS